MPRTTSEAVAGIIEVDDSIDLDPFILPANALVTEICAAAGTLDDVRLEMIERYLSAHFYTLRDPRSTSEQAGPVNASYQSKVDLFLCTSHYGQMAILLDTTGGLAQLNEDAQNPSKVRTLSVTWVGEEGETPNPSYRVLRVLDT